MLGLTTSRIYTVHVPTKRGRGMEQSIFVPEGFSWGAFAFSALWAISKRMWFAAILMAGAIAAVGLADEFADIDPRLQTIVGLLLGLYFGFQGNDWYRGALSRRGYQEAGVVVAPSPIDAEQRWFARHPAPGTQS